MGVRVTLITAASSSTSTCLASSSEAGGVAIFSLPFLERTGMRGFFSGSFSSSFWMMCLFLVLEEVPHVIYQNLPLPLWVSCQSQTCHILPQVDQMVQHLLSQPLLMGLLQHLLLVHLCQWLLH